MKIPRARRWVQAVTLIGFLALFLHTAYRGAALLLWPVHLAFRLDPLAALAEAAAAGFTALGPAWLAAAALLGATALLGRFFCGWMCPTGTTLDLAGGGLRRAAGSRAACDRPASWTGPALLILLLVATFLGLPLLGVFDPLSLLLRTLTLVLHPLFDAGAKGVLAALSSSDLETLRGVGDVLYEFLDPVLAFGTPAFLLTWVTAGVFGAVLLLELWAPRFWCTSLCPLGALLGVTARLSPFRRPRAPRCGRCAACDSACPSGAAALDPADPALCLHCAECEETCPFEARRAVPRLPRASPPAAASPGRRVLLASVGVGALLAVSPRIRAQDRERGWDFLRPPGALAEEEFQKRCIRCGACMRVCPRGALHPAFLEAGPGGLWTPRLVPRLGYCEYHCRLCGQVCPTGAIGYLAAGEKETTVVGIAVFDRNLCIPFRKAENCMVCEEHCPTNPKAIVFEERVEVDPLGRPVPVKLPQVVESRCIGCGICENKCPVPGRGAILVSRENPGNLSSFY